MYIDMTYAFYHGSTSSTKCRKLYSNVAQTNLKLSSLQPIFARCISIIKKERLSVPEMEENLLNLLSLKKRLTLPVK